MSKCSSVLALVAAWLCVSLALAAEEKPVQLKVGDPAPKFQGQSDRGPDGKPTLWKSEDRIGKKILVVYFYPADMTPGCTKQACSYRDALEKLDRDDVEIVGVSGDTVENHQHFRQQYRLPFTLLADPDGKIAEAFGVQYGPGGSIQRVVDGKEQVLTRGVTASRWTFVIGPDNRIVHIDRNVNPSEDRATVWKVLAKIPEIDNDKSTETPQTDAESPS